MCVAREVSIPFVYVAYMDGELSPRGLCSLPSGKLSAAELAALRGRGREHYARLYLINQTINNGKLLPRSTDHFKTGNVSLRIFLLLHIYIYYRVFRRTLCQANKLSPRLLFKIFGFPAICKVHSFRRP